MDLNYFSFAAEVRLTMGNNYFLPLIMLKDSNWYPLTIGLKQWKDQASTAGGQAIQNLVITGSLITIIPTR